MSKVTRRDALVAGTAVGVSALIGSGRALKAQDQIKQAAQSRFQLSKESLHAETERVLNAITAPAFVEEMQRFRAITGDEREKVAAERMTPEAVKALGVSLPNDLRISSRTFEEGDYSNAYLDFERSKRIVRILGEKRPDLLAKLRVTHPKLYDDLDVVKQWPDVKPPVSPSGPRNVPILKPQLAAWGCACAGAATICAGGGGGSDANFVGAELSNETKAIMRQRYDDIIDFVTQPRFKVLVEQMYSLPSSERPAFVKNVLINPEELSRRGIEIPEGILIQRSVFGDRRPTLFVVKKYLPKEHQIAWENVNITFDQQHDAAKILEGSAAWEKPLLFEVQAALQALETSVDDIERLGQK